jgi:ADP-ribosylglycohydrolase
MAGMRVLLLLLSLSACSQAQRSMTVAELRDRIAGAWAGQMIGVAYGAPTEFRSNGRIIEGDLPPWDDQRVANALTQDDLYVDMTFTRVLEQHGVTATTKDFGRAFRDVQYTLWHANLAARRALKRGVPPELSGTPSYNVHANDIDFQIESDFAGIIAPGLPQAGAAIAYRAGRMINSGDGLLGGLFVTCMYSAAYFERDPAAVVRSGLACLPRNSQYHQIVSQTIALQQQYPHDWKAAWRALQQRWDNPAEPCPEGALRDFNINATLNGAYIVLGLLYGKGDLFRTMDIATRSGQDSDCNPSNAAGILGAMLGYRGLPEEWKRGIPAIAQRKFSWTDYSFDSIVDVSLRLAQDLILREGGRRQGEELLIRTQAPRARKVPLWNDFGQAAERVGGRDARWRYSPEWKDVGSPEYSGRTANQAGASAEIEFSGTGFVVVGQYTPSGGQAQLWIDDRLAETFDANADLPLPRGWANWETYGHRFQLPPGKHRVKIIVSGKDTPGHGPGNAGKDITIQGFVVFRK